MLNFERLRKLAEVLKEAADVLERVELMQTTSAASPQLTHGCSPV